ncbi:MAG: hypothetical protein JJ974_08830 [Phycisphaerales bacterium]|nr:hypothetical protein [Phycisphaerales bacterium]
MVGNILQWVKANLLIVISVALMLILLPTGWFFSNKWNASIQEKATEAYNSEKRKLTSASKVEYSLPAVLDGEEGLSDNRAPNTLVTNFYKEQMLQRKEQVAEVVDRGENFNRKGHTVPVSDLLPTPADASKLRQQGFKLGQLVAGTNESPSIYSKLLRSLNAGDAPDPEALKSSLDQFKKQQEDEFAATSSDGRVSDEQKEVLAKSLVKRRLDEYASRAESIAFYCPLSAIQTESQEAGFSHIPSTVPGYDSISEQAVFTWVWDYWVVSDVLKAVTKANTDSSGVVLSVPDAPVKHVEQIRVGEFSVQSSEFNEDDFDSRGGRGGRGGRGSSSDDPSGTPQFKSYTNRNANIPGALYDTRLVHMSAIVSSEDLPVFFDALGKTNYMTVVDVDIEQVNVWDKLNEGYFYGSDHVVRANLVIETVWLRSWTKDLMPKSIRTSLGIVTDEDLMEDDG